MANDRFLVLPPPPASLAVGGSEQIKRSFVSRAGFKLLAAVEAFPLSVKDRVCTDLGANVGGFTDCLLQHGAAKVYAVDTAYGVLAWTLRKHPQVVVKERTNALHLTLPEKVSLIVADVGWTRQRLLLPAITPLLASGGEVLSLIKPHYESEVAKIQKGVLTEEQSTEVLMQTLTEIETMGWTVKGVVRTPIEGQKGNAEFVAWLTKGGEVGG